MSSPTNQLKIEWHNNYEELENEIQQYVENGFKDLLSQSKRLHITNIPFSLTESDLRNLCCKFGEVLDVEIITNSRGSKGFGFVTMKNNEDADRAYKSLNGATLLGRKIEVNAATPRKFTRKQLQMPISPLTPTFNQFSPTIYSTKFNPFSPQLASPLTPMSPQFMQLSWQLSSTPSTSSPSPNVRSTQGFFFYPPN